MSTLNPAGMGRTEFSTRLVAQVMADLISSAEARADALRAAGRWDDLKQLRLDGLRDVVSEIEDCDLRTLSDLAFKNGMDIRFLLSEPEGEDTIAPA